MTRTSIALALVLAYVLGASTAATPVHALSSDTGAIVRVLERIARALEAGNR